MIMRLMMSSPTMNACVSIMRAALTLSSDRRMLAMTDEPMPNISPIPVATMNNGATMLTDAMPSALTPCPTKTPSIIVSAELNIIPTRVGKNKARKTLLIFPLPKSILSRPRSPSFIPLFFRGTKVRIIGITGNRYRNVYSVKRVLV